MSCIGMSLIGYRVDLGEGDMLKLSRKELGDLENSIPASRRPYFILRMPSYRHVYIANRAIRPKWVVALSDAR